MLVFVTIHRLIQIETAKKDLDFYSSLFHFRNAANKQSSFHETLISCAVVLEETLNAGRVSFAETPQVTIIFIMFHSVFKM